MRVRDLDSAFNVSVDEWDIRDFNSRWPASELRGLKGVTFQFDKANGDLSEIWYANGSGERWDGEALSALADDAREYGFKRLEKKRPKKKANPQRTGKERHLRDIALPPELAEEVLNWHGGQGSMVYSLGSTGMSDYVSVSMIEAALNELESDLSRNKTRPKDRRWGRKELAELKNLISELHMIVGFPGEFASDESNSGYATWLMDEDDVESNPKRMKVTYSASDLEAFVDAYLEAALWTATDEEGEPLDREYDSGQFTATAVKKATKDAKEFLGYPVVGILPAKGEKPRTWTVAELIEEYGGSAFGQAGHDFLLTRGGHGAGFWDGDWDDEVLGSPQNLGQILTDVSGRMRKEIYVYADRGKLHMD